MSPILHQDCVTALHAFVPIRHRTRTWMSQLAADVAKWQFARAMVGHMPGMRWEGCQRPKVAGPGVRSTEAMRLRSIARAHASSKIGQRASRSRWRAKRMLAGLVAIALTG